MSNANQEQVEAIKHRGGVLLNAGAGAGKTFVLVEHIKYLIEEFFKENSNFLSNEILLKKNLNQYLSGIVLMTFTNEAARELKTRIYKRFKNEKTYPMSIVEDSLVFMNISTIHGFCLKLISEGFVEGAPANIELFDEEKISLKIEKLVTLWVEKEPDNDETQLLLKNLKSINESMRKIFLTPELRSLWANSTELKVFNEEIYFENFLRVLGVLAVWRNHFSIESFSDNSSTKWFQLIDRVNKLKKMPLKFENLKLILNIFDDLGRVVAPKNDEVKNQIEDIREIKSLVQKYSEDFEQFFSFSPEFNHWREKLCSLFNFVEERYYHSPGISFSDLEYLVMASLSNNKQLQDSVSRRFKYIIVDEYQDTSSIQYEILKLVTGGDLNRIFCVGDRKQAIYGFRGGELGVFNETAQKINRTLLLRNNYRSEESVVDFNNSFFSFLFPLGKEYKDLDVNQVVVDPQVFPETKEKRGGKIYKKRISISDEEIKKLSSDDLNQLEAVNILSSIKSFATTAHPQVCVLYRNLGPSQKLIDLLIQNNISFEAQVKIPYSEDPTVIIFLKFIDSLVEIQKIKNEALVAENKRVIHILKYLNFMVSNVLGHFSLESKEISINELISIHENIPLIGLELSFIKFVNKLGISNSMYKDNLSKLLEIIALNNSNVDKIWEYLRRITSEKYSTKFYFGVNPKVKIMTTHASKGLQFENVILGGIHTNGRSVSDQDFIGKAPEAFKWTNDMFRKKLYSSPELILENLIDKQKEFSESKRLFYVACTRAIQTISWCDISLNNKEQQSNNGAWICALRKFSYENIEEESIDGTIENQKISHNPIYFKDALGINVAASRSIGLISEVSVTKLALLALCSKKFYFTQILKLDEQWGDLAEENDIHIPKRIGISDAKRGVRVHKSIENIIAGIPFQKIDSDSRAIEWIKNKIVSYQEFKFLSEKEIKFSLFGQMLTGIPDLIIEKKNQEFEIWDFKTGILGEDDSEQYFFQLQCYALAYAQVNNLDKNLMCTLKIMALDQEEEVVQKKSIKDCEAALFQTWLRLGDFSTKKINHCSICEYGNLCH